MKRIIVIGLVCVLASFQAAWCMECREVEDPSEGLFDIVAGILSAPCDILSLCLGLQGDGYPPEMECRLVRVPVKKDISEPEPIESPSTEAGAPRRQPTLPQPSLERERLPRPEPMAQPKSEPEPAAPRRALPPPQPAEPPQATARPEPQAPQAPAAEPDDQPAKEEPGLKYRRPTAPPAPCGPCGPPVPPVRTYDAFEYYTR